MIKKLLLIIFLLSSLSLFSQDAFKISDYFLFPLNERHIYKNEKGELFRASWFSEITNEDNKITAVYETGPLEMSLNATNYEIIDNTVYSIDKNGNKNIILKKPDSQWENNYKSGRIEYKNTKFGNTKIDDVEYKDCIVLNTKIYIKNSMYENGEYRSVQIDYYAKGIGFVKSEISTCDKNWNIKNTSLVLLSTIE